MITFDCFGSDQSIASGSQTKRLFLEILQQGGFIELFLFDAQIDVDNTDQAV